MRHHLLTALLFGLSAAIVRAMAPDVKTRLQIAVFLSLAAAFELLLLAARGQRPSMTRFSLNALAILLAAIAVKIAIDGQPHVPGWIRQTAIALGIPL